MVVWLSSVLASVAMTNTVAAEPSPATSFAADNAAAMRRMMSGMDIKPSGNVDHDFAAMMTAHHQGAIEMAEAELRYGHDEALRRIAQGMIVEQRQEIDAMRAAVSETSGSSQGRPGPVQQRPSPEGARHGE